MLREISGSRTYYFDYYYIRILCHKKMQDICPYINFSKNDGYILKYRNLYFFMNSNILRKVFDTMILYNGIPNFQKIHTNYDYNISLW